jgi:hypothetical protein
VILDVAQRADEPREVLEIAAEGEHLLDRPWHDEGKRHGRASAPSAEPPQRVRKGGARRGTDQRQAAHGRGGARTRRHAAPVTDQGTTSGAEEERRDRRDVSAGPGWGRRKNR